APGPDARGDRDQRGRDRRRSPPGERPERRL
ncbi:MAG: hypothetical protein AVDCRST_MAG19-994, partial [uncultured Thermomicrobiales bacterium]